MSDDLPQTWAEAIDRLARVVGGGEEGLADAWEWAQQALEARWGVRDPMALTRPQRMVAKQKLAGVVWHLEGETEIAFERDLRRIVRDAFARYFAGAALEGPPWRINGYEPLPTRLELLQHDDDFAAS